MRKLQEDKDKIRKKIFDKKEALSQSDLQMLSDEVLMTLELTDIFQKAKIIFIYNSLPDEVQTLSLIERWQDNKDFYFPVVVGDNLVFRKYTAEVLFDQSKLGVLEPLGDNFTEYKKVDLIIIPGVSFDRKKNRLGRGKGYYDRFLKTQSAPKVGICFDFQLLDDIPVGGDDIKMDYIVSENDFIW